MFQGFNVEGWRFGKLVALGRLKASEKVYWVCACDCGNFTLATVSVLRKAKKAHCGCAPGLKIHKSVKGFRQHPLYFTWCGMFDRCYRPTTKCFRHYGGRGIKVCEEWRDFRAFLAWAGVRPEGRSIDRIDNDGNYEPGNCRWATSSEQAANKRRVPIRP